MKTKLQKLLYQIFLNIGKILKLLKRAIGYMIILEMDIRPMINLEEKLLIKIEMYFIFNHFSSKIILQYHKVY